MQSTKITTQQAGKKGKDFAMCDIFERITVRKSIAYTHTGWWHAFFFSIIPLALLIVAIGDMLTGSHAFPRCVTLPAAIVLFTCVLFALSRPFLSRRAYFDLIDGTLYPTKADLKKRKGIPYKEFKFLSISSNAPYELMLLLKHETYIVVLLQSSRTAMKKDAEKLSKALSLPLI